MRVQVYFFISDLLLAPTAEMAAALLPDVLDLLQEAESIQYVFMAGHSLYQLRPWND